MENFKKVQNKAQLNCHFIVILFVNIFQIFKWNSQILVSFQSWLNRNFGREEYQFKAFSKFRSRDMDDVDWITTLPYHKQTFSYDVVEKFTKLHEIYDLRSQIIFPMLDATKNCSITILSNLAYPEWVNVGCEEKLLIDTVCQLKQNQSDSDAQPPLVENKCCAKD